MHAKQPRKFNAWFLVFGVVTMLLIYALSMRPAVTIASHRHGGMAVIRQIYFPIVWLHDYTPLGKPTEAYVNIWE